jgi:hypothetical protein
LRPARQAFLKQLNNFRPLRTIIVNMTFLPRGRARILLIIGVGILLLGGGAALLRKSSPKEDPPPSFGDLLVSWSSKSTLAADKPVRPPPGPGTAEAQSALDELIAQIGQGLDEKISYYRGRLRVIRDMPGGPEVMERYLQTGQNVSLGDTSISSLRFQMLRKLSEKWSSAAAREHDYVLEHPENTAELLAAVDGLRENEREEGYVDRRLLEYTEEYLSALQKNDENGIDVSGGLAEIMLVFMTACTRDGFSEMIPTLEKLLIGAPVEISEVYPRQFHGLPGSMQEAAVKRLGLDHPLLSDFGKRGTLKALDFGQPSVRTLALKHLSDPGTPALTEFLGSANLPKYCSGGMFAPDVFAPQGISDEFRDESQRAWFNTRLDGLDLVLDELAKLTLKPEDRANLAQRQADVVKLREESKNWPLRQAAPSEE